MGNIFISALIAIFFLGKSSKEKQEKTRNASGFRTIIYLFLSIITGVLFYKSYQVSTIRNTIELKALRGVEDSLKQSKDIAKIHIVNKFRCVGSYNNKFLDIENEFGEDSSVTKYGGVVASIRAFNTPVDSIKRRSDFTIEEENYLSKRFQKDVSEMGQFYSLFFLSTNIPNFIPIYPKEDDIPTWVPEKDAYTRLSYHTDFKKRVHFFVSDSEGTEQELSNEGSLTDLYDNSTLIENYWLSNQKRDTPYYDLSMYCPYPYINTIGFLTAADISQYTYIIEIPSTTDVSIQSMKISYNLPIEITQEMDGVHVGAKGVVISEDYIKKLHGSALMLHVKLPTMANLQMIRSLILTALATSFFSLFFTNFYFWLRMLSLSYKKKHKLSVSVLRRLDRKRIKLFRNSHRLIAIMLVLLVGYVAWMVFVNKTILISFDIKWYEIVGYSLLIIVIFSFVNYHFYKYAITPLPKKRGKDKIREASKAEK